MKSEEQHTTFTQRTGKVLIIYTGGTIGMGISPVTGALEPLDFSHFVENVPEAASLCGGHSPRRGAALQAASAGSIVLLPCRLSGDDRPSGEDADAAVMVTFPAAHAVGRPAAEGFQIPVEHGDPKQQNHDQNQWQHVQHLPFFASYYNGNEKAVASATPELRVKKFPSHFEGACGTLR